jgi:hypothetical protein
MQTLSVILSLICRIALVGLAVAGFASDFKAPVVPAYITQEWSAMFACGCLAILAPLVKWRNPAVVAGLLALGVHYWYRHNVETWNLWYTGIAILLVLLPRYRLKPKKGWWKTPGEAASSRGERRPY